MTASISTEDYALDLKNAANTLKDGNINYCSCTIKEIDTNADYNKVLSMTAMSIKTLSNSFYKSGSYVEASDIEQIKSSLINYKGNDQVIELKRELVEDLTAFQKRIRENHVQRIAELTKEKQFLEKQIQVLEFEKHKLLVDRLTKLLWPSNTKTKEVECKIKALQMQAQQKAQRALELSQNRPIANEKDILIYQMHLKEKFAK